MADGPDESESAIEALRLARKESRAVLDHQLSTLNDIDDISLRTGRLAIILLALMVSVGQLMEQGELDGLHRLTRVAIGISFLSFTATMILGIAAFFSTDVPTGIGEPHRDELLAEGYSERAWLELLLSEYDDWTNEAAEDIAENSRLLEWSQTALIVGIVYLFVTGTVLFTPYSAPVVFVVYTSIGLIALLALAYLQRGTDDD